MKKTILGLLLAAAMTLSLAACGNKPDAADGDGGAVSGTENTPVETAQEQDAAVADLVGTWEEPDTFGGRNNTLTVREDGSFALEYAAGGTRFGTVELLAEEHPDGSRSLWYAFYEPDGALWESFAVPAEKPFDDIYSGQDGNTHFVRIREETEQSAPEAAWRYVLTTETRTEEERNDAGVLLATTSYELPTLSAVCDDASQEPPEAQRTVCEAFNRRVAAYAESLTTAKQLAGDAEEQYNEMGEEYRENFPTYTEELRVSESRRFGDLLEVSFQTYGYWGGAHGGASFFTWHFDLSEGAFFEPADLSDRPEELNRMIADEIIAAIEQANEADGLFEDYAETIRAKDSFEVYFGTDAMDVGFEQYEIAPYAAGMPSYAISYDKLTPFLNARGQRLLAELLNAR